MILRPSRLLVGVALLLVLVSALPAQFTGDTRSLFKEPKTPAEFFGRVKFEIELGNYALAAQYLNGLLASNPQPPDLVALEKTEGTTAFLKLRNIPRWSEVPSPTAAEETKKAAAALDARAKKDVETLIQLVTKAVKDNLTDPERILKYVRRLSLGPQEYDFAMGELYRSGTLVVPYILDELRSAEGDQRVALLKALTQFGPDATPPIIAGLESNVPALQFDLIAVLRKRGAVEAVPYLYWILGNTQSPPALRDAARNALVLFLRVQPTQLPSARAALTDEAERYYQHKVQFADPNNVVVWRWDGQRVVQGFPERPTLPASKAEEYYATRFATQALAIDPAYEPAQIVLASLILDKNYAETGTAKALAETRPAIHQMLSALKPDILTAVLERGLRNKRNHVILGALRILGDQGEVRANLPRDLAQSPLMQALNYPDARVQLIAAETQIKVPGPVAPATAVRVVDILKRALAADAISKKEARLIVGYFAENQRAQVSDTVRQMGYLPVSFGTGRAAIRRLQEASDIDALLLDADLPDPGLPNLLAQLKADRNARAVPVFLTAEPRSLDRWRLYTEKNPQVRLLPVAITGDPAELKAVLREKLNEPDHKPLSAEEIQNHGERAILALARLTSKQVPGYDVSPAAVPVFDVLRSGKLSVEGRLAAITVIGTLVGTRPQSELLEALAQPTHPKEVRIAAAETLVRHIQQYGLALGTKEIDTVPRIAADDKLDPAFRSALAALLGALNPTARLSGERLQNYRPDLAPPPKP